MLVILLILLIIVREKFLNIKYEKIYLSYIKLIEQAKIQEQKIVEQKESERLAKFAEAEYFAIYEDAMVIPWYIPGRGPRVSVSKIVPYQAMKGSVGCVASKYKFMEVRKTAISRAEREELKAEYEAGKGEN